MKQILALATTLFLCVVFFAHGDDLYLRNNLFKAKVGDYIVTSANRTNTVLVITGKSDYAIQIQEVCVPEERFPPGMSSWRQWLEQKAPGHTSWIVYDVSPQDGRLLESFSYTKNGWLESGATDNFLGTLLNLRLQPLETKQRRRVGRSSLDAKDSRGFWQPRLVVEGHTVPNASFNAWRTRWPNDGTELASKNIELYLPSDEGTYPAYFPYWLQVSGVAGKARMRIIDSGMGLRSPMPPMPMRPLAFLNNGRIEEGSLRLWLRTRPYYSDYHLIAIDAKDPSKKIPLPFSIQMTEDPNVLMVEVPPKELAGKLSPGGHYRFSMSSWKHPTSGAETVDALRWNPR